MLRFHCQSLQTSLARVSHFRNHWLFIASSSFSSATPPNFGDYDIILPPEPYFFGVSHIVPRTVPNQITRPQYAKRQGCRVSNSITPGLCKGDGPIGLASEDESCLRKAARLAKRVRNYASTLTKVLTEFRMNAPKAEVWMYDVQVGATTNSIDAAIHEFIISHLAYPSPLLYMDFPRSCCTSVNNIIAHGIPDERVLCSRKNSRVTHHVLAVGL
jgi:methionyl aminopeptidase